MPTARLWWCVTKNATQELCTRVCGRRVLRTSPKRSSRKFAKKGRSVLTPDAWQRCALCALLSYAGILQTSGDMHIVLDGNLAAAVCYANKRLGGIAWGLIAILWGHPNPPHEQTWEPTGICRIRRARSTTGYIRSPRRSWLARTLLAQGCPRVCWQPIPSLKGPATS